MTRRLLSALLIGSALVLPGLTAGPTVSAQDASSLEGRVLQDRAKRQAKDLSGAWTFYCAAYQARVSQPQFMQMTRLLRFDLRDIKVARIQMAGAKADVTISYQFAIPTMPDRQVEGQAQDAWSNGSDGQWCKEDEPLVLPFPTSSSPTAEPGNAGVPPSLPPGAATPGA